MAQQCTELIPLYQTPKNSGDGNFYVFFKPLLKKKINKAGHHKMSVGIPKGASGEGLCGLLWILSRAEGIGRGVMGQKAPSRHKEGMAALVGEQVSSEGGLYPVRSS